MPPKADMRPEIYPLLPAARVQARVISALVIRNMMMKYGRANIGFLWVVIEPILLCAGVMIIWSLIKSPNERGVALVALVLTGYMPLTLFRHLTNAGVHIFRRSMPFLYHRHITFIDVIAAAFCLELIGTTTALVVVYLALLSIDVVSPIRDPGLCVAAWLTMAALSAGIGAIFAILTELSETTERLIQPVQYLILPLSGAFYMVEWLPSAAQKWAWYMPTVHCYEMFRAGFFGEEVHTHFDAWYPLSIAVVFLAIGVCSIDRIRDKMHTG